jgi:hypothetical protein
MGQPGITIAKTRDVRHAEFDVVFGNQFVPNSAIQGSCMSWMIAGVFLPMGRIIDRNDDVFVSIIVNVKRFTIERMHRGNDDYKL